MYATKYLKESFPAAIQKLLKIDRRLTPNLTADLDGQFTGSYPYFKVKPFLRYFISVVLQASSCISMEELFII
jgi:hypothetical protein